MSLRQAWSRGSSRTDGPSSEILRSVLEKDAPFLGRAAAARAFRLLDIAFEALKKLLPYAGLGDEDVAAVRFVAHPAQIAERAQRIQGAGHDRLGNAEHPRKAQVVVMRYFGGLSEDEIAQALEVTPRTVERDWRFARAYLHALLSAGPA